MKYLVTDIETTPTSGVGKIPEPTPEKPDPFPPLPCHVPVVIGCLLFDDAYLCTGYWLLTQRLQSERKILASFSDHAEDRNIVTWNGRSFDLPVIILRCLRYGVQLPWYYRNRGMRYRFDDQGHHDVMDFLSDFGAARNLSLNDAAQVIGLPGKLDVDGKKVADIWASGREGQETVENYCMTDVVQTAFVWLRHQFVRGVIGIEQYREVTKFLLARCETNDERYGELLARTNRRVLLLEEEDGSEPDRRRDEDAGGSADRAGVEPGVRSDQEGTQRAVSPGLVAPDEAHGEDGRDPGSIRS